MSNNHIDDLDRDLSVFLRSKKSPIKWVGGKSWMAPRIAGLYEPHRHRRFVEPFAGGLGVSFYLRPERVLANDINPFLINFFRRISDCPHQPEYENTSEAFYANRVRYNELMRLGTKDTSSAHTRELASLFYYLNRTAFNGLYRTNKKGEFNAPYGKYPKPKLLKDLTPYQEIISGWMFITRDFIPALEVCKEDDFIFADPPYDSTFVGYADGGFGWPEQVVLANLLAAHPGPVIATNNATERIIELYTSLGFTLEFIERKHKVNPGKETGPRPVEMFATKNL